MSESAQQLDRNWFDGGGELGELIRNYDWSKTPLGARSSWSLGLKMAVRLMLSSRQPIWIGWGPELTYLYNDPYRSILCGKHPKALGQPTAMVWHEIWNEIGPMLQSALNGVEGTYVEDHFLIMERKGYPEEVYYTFSYTPLADESGNNCGIFCANSDDTKRVIGERQIDVLRELASSTSQAKTWEEACKLGAAALSAAAKDLPFVLIYIGDERDNCLKLSASTGIAAGHSIAPVVVEGSRAPPFPARSALSSHAVQVVPVPDHMTCPSGAWDRPPTHIVVAPLPEPQGLGREGLLVAGLNPYRKFDDSYKAFVESVAAQLATAINQGDAYEVERRRAEALAEIDHAKTVFFSNVSHEFRTPLTLMLGPLEELKQAFGTAASRLSDAQYRQIDFAHRNSLRLLKLTNTLLDFSRIEAGRAQAVFEETDLSALTAELASLFRSAMEKAGLRFIVDCPPLSERAFIDSDMWEKIVLNFLSNAFKFTFAGEVEIALREEEHDFVLSVRDTGTGIPADQLNKIFERFHRVAGSQGRTHEGSGIGLALVQELVHLHGGSVAVDSVYGRGTIMRASIRKGRAHLTANQIGSGVQAPGNDLARTFVQEALSWLPADQELLVIDDSPLSKAADGPKPRILLADDNSDMRDYLMRLLSARYEVETAPDGEAALAAARQRVPDLILADVMMPKLDGFGLLQGLRDNEPTRTKPIIMLSARAGEEAKVEGLTAGADDYLVKPFSARELLARVESQLQLARARQLSEERSTRILNSMTDGFHTVDANLRFTSQFNAAARRMFEAQGFSPDALVGKHVFEDVFPEALDFEGGKALVTTMTERKPTAVEAYFPAWGRHFNIRHYPTDDGGVATFFQDVTERKTAEETQTLLLNELNHRVKNTLASVQAIAQQTLRATPDPTDFVQSFGGRIQSLSGAHSLLTKTTWQGAQLEDLIRNQLFMGPVDEAQVALSGPAVSLPAQLTMHLALMIHELCTNSCKYGALSISAGRVDVAWRTEGSQLKIKWSERGGPRVKVTGRRGFGSNLIERSANSAGGSASMSADPEGIVWNISVSVPPIESGRIFGSAPAPAKSSAPHRPASLPAAEPRRLAGLDVLVIEDEPLVALDIVSLLEDAGAGVVGPSATPNDALALIGTSKIDVALVDGNLAGKPVDAIIAALTRYKIPFVLVTGYGRESLPNAFSQAPLLGKPFTGSQLIEAVQAVLDEGSNGVRLKG